MNKHGSHTPPPADAAEGSSKVPLHIAFRLVNCIPSEMEAVNDLTTSQVAENLMPYLEVILHFIQEALYGSNSHGSTLPIPPESNNNGASIAANVVQLALQALRSWAAHCRVTLSHLNTPTCGGPHALLPRLMEILSSPTACIPHTQTNSNISAADIPRIWKAAGQALSEAILVPSDHCTPSREAAAAMLYNSISVQGFCGTPLAICTQQQQQGNGGDEWEEGALAVATLVTTLVSEQVDDIVAHEGQACIQVLLQIQAHPHVPVTLTALDCWLTIQEIPTNERHEQWKHGLYVQVVQGLLARVAYPSTTFTTWEDDNQVYIVEENEWGELRRMVTDVLVNAYYLLRSSYIQLVVTHIVQSRHWIETEAALFALTQVAREVSSRLRQNKAIASIQHDKQVTSQQLLHLLQHVIVSTTPEQVVRDQHVGVLRAMIAFCGSYASSWNAVQCPSTALLQVVSYLRNSFAIVPHEASKAIRAIYIGCLAKIINDVGDNGSNTATSTSSNGSGTSSPLPTPGGNAELTNSVLHSIRDCMHASLSSTDESAMATVAEGATRFINQITDSNVARQALVQDLIHPLSQRSQAALAVLTASNSISHPSAQEILAMETLTRYFAVAQVIVRFSDTPSMNTPSSSIPLGQVVFQELSPLMDQSGAFLQSSLSPNDSGSSSNDGGAVVMILPNWIAVHQQFLRTLPATLIAPGCLHQIIPCCLQALSHTQHPATLEYVGAAVEVLGSASAEGVSKNDISTSFSQILSHMTSILVNHLSSVKSMQAAAQNGGNGAHDGSDTSSASSDIIRAYFDCLNRYIMYCPEALLLHADFATIVRVGVDCITAYCQQERESTRATLNFLSHLFGWHVLRLSPQTLQVFSSVKDRVSQILIATPAPQSPMAVAPPESRSLGEHLTYMCVGGLIGGGPQMLWPSYSDCLVSVVANLIIDPTVGGGNTQTIGNGNSGTPTQAPHGQLVFQWLFSSMTSSCASIASSMPQTVVDDKDRLCNQVCTILLTMTQQMGAKSRPKAKMLLTDFAKIVTGEMTPDALVSYALP